MKLDTKKNTIHPMCKECMYGCSLLVGGRGDSVCME